MKLKRRFALNLLAPAPLAALSLTIVFFAKEPSWPALGFLAYATLFAYVFAILPSLVHALVLDACYRAGLAPRSLRAVLFSTFTGAIAGLAIGLFFAATSGGDPGGLLMFIPLGAATGTLNGLLQFLVRD